MEKKKRFEFVLRKIKLCTNLISTLLVLNMLAVPLCVILQQKTTNHCLYPLQHNLKYIVTPIKHSQKESTNRTKNFIQRDEY